jgi:thioredoxin-related protein
LLGDTAFFYQHLISFIMKKIHLTLYVVVLQTVLCFSQNAASAPKGGIQWITWESAIALNQKAPKKIMVDVFTDWCGWCKKMDKGTFMDSAVVAYVNDQFYAVKLNAEQREDINFNTEVFKFIPSETGRGGVHSLAYALLDGKMGYPTMVYLNEKYERIMISPGYKETPDMLKELTFAAEEHYTKTTWDEFRGGK